MIPSDLVVGLRYLVGFLSRYVTLDAEQESYEFPAYTPDGVYPLVRESY